MNSKLKNVYRQIPASTCEQGCGECCGILFPSLAELRNIKDWCEEHNIEYKDFNYTEGLDCPYLSPDKKCEIYPVRPFLCRLLGVSSALPCPLKKCTPARILNHFQSNALYKAIYLHGKEKCRTEKHRALVRKLLSQQN